MKVFVLGNEYIKEDSYALKLSKNLSAKGFDFVECQSVDEFLEQVKGLKQIIVLDVAKVNDVMLVTEKELKNSILTNSHDFDIGFFISLLKEMGELEKINIIAIPQRELDENILKKVKEKLQQLVSS